MNAGEYSRRLLEIVAAIRVAETEYEHAIEKAAAAERAYKRREAIAMVSVEDYRNADDRRAKVELLGFEDGNTVGDLRYAAHLAEGLRDAAKLAVRNRGSELSALQSEASLAKEEARFLTTAPREAVGA